MSHPSGVWFFSASFLVVAAFVLCSSCGSGDSDSSGDDSDLPLYIECFDGETSDAEASALRSPPKAGDDDGSDWPEGLPPCPPFDDTMFFAPPGLDVYEQFAEAVFPAKSIPCTVFLDGNDAELACPFDLNVALTWTWPEGHFPFSDGDVVRLYMEYGDYDPPTYAMAISDLDSRVLALATPSSFVFSTSKIDCTDVDADVQTEYSCEYAIDEAPPRNWPEEDDGASDWTRVFGRSAAGHFMDISWMLENPADLSTSTDGGYFAVAPVSFMGEFFVDDDIVTTGYVGRSRFHLQLVKRWD